MPNQIPHSLLPYLIGIGVLVVVMAFRLRSMSRMRRLRLEWLWVTPAVILVVTVLSLIPQPPQGLDWAWLGGGFLLGAALGWPRGKMMHIAVDPETHALNTRAPPTALLFLVFLIGVRFGLRSLALGEAQDMHLSVSVITGAFLTLALGLLGVQRLEMALRASRLLTQARAARASALAAERA
jgi:hypothetical protein